MGAVTRALTVVGGASHGVCGSGGGGGRGLSRGAGGNSSRRGRREEGGPTPLVPHRPDSKYTVSLLYLNLSKTDIFKPFLLTLSYIIYYSTRGKMVGII